MLSSPALAYDPKNMASMAQEPERLVTMLQGCKGTKVLISELV